MQLIRSRLKLWKTAVLAIASSLVFLAVFLSIVGTGAVDASPKDDAYHYMSNGIDDQLYQEWWRFYASDNDTHLMLLYLLSDPENKSSARKIEVQAVAMQDGQPVLQGEHFSRGYGGDINSPMIDIDKSGFSLEDESDLHVWGEVEDRADGERIHWDLVFQPLAKPWFAIPVQAHFGHIKGNWIKWLAYMPSAQVSGSMKIGNRTIPIRGTGSHDHAWGRFSLSDPRITSASVSNPLEAFSLSFFEVSGEERLSQLGIQKDEKSIVFSDRQITLNYTGYAFDNESNSTFPEKYLIEADNGNYRLNLTVDAIKSAVDVLDYEPPALSILFIQQASLLQGTLQSKTGEIYSFNRTGFSHYSAGIVP
jgi:hypothetical protein